jgi:hypothetical protein
MLKRRPERREPGGSGVCFPPGKKAQMKARSEASPGWGGSGGFPQYRRLIRMPERRVPGGFTQEKRLKRSPNEARPARQDPMWIVSLELPSDVSFSTGVAADWEVKRSKTIHTLGF